MSSSEASHTSPVALDQKRDAFHASLLTNKEDFARWRPSYHLIAPRGWMNDPCAPGFVPSTQSYHVGFQWNPNGAEWGDIVWGNAFSKDLVTWEVAETPVLQAGAPYDRLAVFTGCWHPTGVDGAQGRAGDVMVAYTSVSSLPIHFTREYNYGCESLAVATSSDGGRTWAKLDANPILPGPPAAEDATGWRDPYIAHWPAMRELLARRRNGAAAGAADEGGDLFAIVSGGVRHKSPTTWLYRLEPSDLTKWEFIAPLVQPGVGFAPSRWTGHLGANWEVTNFVSVQDAGRQHSQDFLIFGAEGCTAPHGGAGVVPGTPRPNRAQLWVAIDAHDSPPEDGTLTKYAYGGFFDHGLFYAANGFWDPATQQHVVLGWVTEDDLPVEAQARQGWSGCLSLPRVVTLTSIPHVARSSKSPLGALTCMKAIPEERSGLYTMQTLCIKPDPRLQKLRLGASEHEVAGLPADIGRQAPRLPLATALWEAVATFASVGTCKRVGLRIHHAGTTEVTALYFSPADETFVIERPPRSLRAADGTTKLAATRLQDEAAPFTLLTGTGGEEQLQIHLFYDTSVLEVFVNERAAITTRVYLSTTACSAVEFFAEASSPVVLEEARVWDGLSQ